MDPDTTCDDFQFANTSSSNENCLDFPCDNLLKESPSKTKDPPLGKASVNCDPIAFNTSSSSSSMLSGIMSQKYCSTKEPLLKVPNISQELAVAKSIMQQYSSISGDNLFDHLSDIIKRVIDERPPNVIDFFEEFSRNVREQKFHLPERFPPHAVFEETRLYKVAKKQLISMKLPNSTDLMVDDEDALEEEPSRHDVEVRLDLKEEFLSKFRTFNDRVQHLQFFWNQCGFSISSDDIFLLACSMNRLQTHPSIMQCRFWGMINGLKASYYVVEASLSNSEFESRLLQMEKEIQESHMNQNENEENQELESHIGPELIPGAVGWENHPIEEILQMKPQVLQVPLVKNAEIYDVLPEPIGSGVNRYSYFVVNSLHDEWIELPISTPTQISLSRCIKKFFTGDLEENIDSYPCFYGKEKHYLRAMIARITAGTYIAPRNYYRKMTELERRLFDGEDYDGGDDEEEEEEEAEAAEVNEDDNEKEPDNDIVLLKNETYDSTVPIDTLNNPEKWVHIRPNILLQGRVVWYNQAKVERERQKEQNRLEKIRSQEQKDEDESEYNVDEDEDEDDDQENEEEELEVHAEKGPAILTACSLDTSSETPVPWVARFTSKFTNQNERIIIMQSNVWPGAYTFAYKDICESIYLGWGHKAVSRNTAWRHLPPIQEEYKQCHEDFIESIDPSLEMEQSYQLALFRKTLKPIQMVDEDESLESDEDTDDDKDEDEDEDK